MKQPMFKVTGFEFRDTITVYEGDTIEYDWKRKKAMVVSSVGKVRTSTDFKVVELDNGESATAGA
jgi:hypothetical protein